MHITVPYLCWPYYVLHPSCFFYNPLLYPSSPHFTFYYICTVHVMNYTYMYVNVLTTCSIVHTVQKLWDPSKWTEVWEVCLTRNLHICWACEVQWRLRNCPTKTDYEEMMTNFTEVSCMESWNSMTVLFE